MIWLEAFLAFALTMIVFSTMVTAVMEIVHRLLNSREAGFELMVQRIFDDVIWPRIEMRLANDRRDQLRKTYVNAITCNSVVPDRPVVGDAGSGLTSRIGAAIANRTAPTTVATMSVMEFVERTAGTEVGWALATESQTVVAALINDLAQKYDRFCRGAKEHFYNKARAWSVFVSLVLAFAINVDAVRLFQAYLQDQPLRQVVIDQQDRIGQEMRTAEALRKEAQADSAKGAASKVDQERIEKRIKDLGDGLAQLKTAGVPVGWDYYPGCLGKSIDNTTPIDPHCWPRDNWRSSLLNVVSWTLSVLLAGFLIGLGAPFWFDLASGLSKSLRLLKVMGVGEKTEKTAEPQMVAAAGTDGPPRTPVEAFRTAIAASPAGTRLLLSPTGEAIAEE